MKTRIGFAVLLFTFGELVAWQHGPTYSLMDWMVVVAIYLAITAIVLDLIVRWYSQEWLNILLVGGVFGILQSGLITLDLHQDLPITFVVYATGLQTVLCCLAYASFRFLYTGQIASKWLYTLAPIVGFITGIWTHSYPTAKTINLPIPTLGETLPYSVIALIGSAFIIFYLPLPEKVNREDWLLTPMEWGVAGLVLFVTLVLRLERGYIPVTGLIFSLVVIGMLILLIWFAQNKQEFSLPIQPQQILIIRWVLMFIPFALTFWVGYKLPESNLLFIVFAIFGASWLPMVSLYVSIRAFTELGRQEY